MVALPDAKGCWFAHIGPELSKEIIIAALQPVPGHRGPGASLGKTLTYFCNYPTSLPAGVYDAARAIGIFVDASASYERLYEFRLWLERLLLYHGICFGNARYFRKQDDEEESGYRICAYKRVVLQEAYDVYQEFLYACRARAEALPEFVRPMPRSLKDRDDMLKDIAKEAKERGLCPTKLKIRDINAGLFFV